MPSDGQGGFVTTWSQLANAWAKATEQTPRERFYRGEDAHTQGVTFTIRQPQTFTLDTRTSDKLKIVHRGIDFRIVGISRNKFNLDFTILVSSNGEQSHNENARCCLLLYAEISSVMTLIASCVTNTLTANSETVDVTDKSVLFRELLENAGNSAALALRHKAFATIAHRLHFTPNNH